MDGLGNVFIIDIQFLLNRNLIVKTLVPRHEICGATELFLPVYHEASRRGSLCGRKLRKSVLRGSVWPLL